MTTLAIRHHRYGPPEEVVQLDTLELGPLANDDVRIAMHYSPINPADLNMIEGQYLEQPPLPSVLGNEGVGIIEEIGKDVTDLKPGDIVITPLRLGSQWRGAWAQYRDVPAQECLVCPEGIDLKQAAMLSINPLTAWCFLDTIVPLKKGDWILQNLAHSGVGHAVIQLAKVKGLKTINLVRNKSHQDALLAQGADEVWIDQKDVFKEICKKDPDRRISLGLNGVGGQSAKEVAKALSTKGTMVTYGAMAREPLQLSNRLLIYDDKRFIGFNRTRWVKDSTESQVRQSYEHIIPLCHQGVLQIPVEKCYPANQVSDAIQCAMQSGRKGKVLLAWVTDH